MSESGLMPEKEFSALAQQTIRDLESKTVAVFDRVKESRVWKAATNPQSSNELVKAIIREVFFSIYSYQRHTTEAGFLMISRHPKSEIKLLGALTAHKVDEAEHGEWARRDYLLLGGSESRLSLPISPSTFAVAATWWRMAQVEDAWGYLGAEYLFEYLTVIASAPMVALFKNRGFSRDGFAFIIDHATEDVKHTNLLRHLVGHSVTKYPETPAAMLRCFDYFAQVYPIPVWEEAYDRAITK